MNAHAVLAAAILACASGRDTVAPAKAADADAPAPAGDGGAAEDAPCAGDGDCALTRMEAGACCPMLCTPRVVTRQRAAELEAGPPGCAQRKRETCPQPLCRPPLHEVAPSCQGGRCVARILPSPPN